MKKKIKKHKSQKKKAAYGKVSGDKSAVCQYIGRKGIEYKGSIGCSKAKEAPGPEKNPKTTGQSKKDHW